MLKFTDANGRPVWVNPLHVSVVEPATRLGGAEAGTVRLSFAARHVSVKGTVDEVVEALEKETKRILLLRAPASFT